MPWQIKTQLLSAVPKDVVRVRQVHEGVIVWSDEARPETPADGIAARPDESRSFMVRSADCLPLVIIGDTAVCAMHVSRKSVLHGLLDQVPNFVALDQITKVFIGPHICAEHFVFKKLGPEIQAFAQAYPYACRETRTGLSLNISAVAEEYLRTWGVDATTISRDGRCTFETLELPSYRRALRDNQSLSDGIATIVQSA